MGTSLKTYYFSYLRIWNSERFGRSVYHFGIVIFEFWILKFEDLENENLQIGNFQIEQFQTESSHIENIQIGTHSKI